MVDIVKVFSVDEVLVQITRTNSPCLVIHATGRALSTGWSEGQLSKHVHVAAPADNIQAFDLVAEKPGPGIPVLDVLTVITAHAELLDADVENYWGKGRALKGIRVHAAANTKTVDVLSRREAAALNSVMTPQSTASYVGEIRQGQVPGFAEDIKPLFRNRDVAVMQAIKGFNLHNYEDVKAWAERISGKLKIDMPCDGLWPAEDIAKFDAWKDGGMPA